MNHIITKLLYSFSLILFAFSLNAQSDKSPVKEFGIGLSGLDNFSLQYRWGNENKLHNLTGGIGLTFVSSNSYASELSALQFSGTYSILHLKSINPNFGFLIGPSFGIGLNKSSSETSFTNSRRSIFSFGPRVGVVLGGYCKVNSEFYIYGSINPNLFYNYVDTNYNSTGDPDNNYNSFGISGLNNSGAMLTLAYRFQNGTK